MKKIIENEIKSAKDEKQRLLNKNEELQNSSFKDIIKSGFESAKAEDRELIREWKHHPVKMVLLLLSLIASVVIGLLITFLIEVFSFKLAYDSIDNVIFISQNDWSDYACSVTAFMLIAFFVMLFFFLIETGADAFNSRKSKKRKEEISFSEQEIKKEQSVSRLNKIEKAVAILIPTVIILVFIASIYVWTFSSTVFTKDKIIKKTPFNPVGAEYSYSEITEIEIDNKNDDSNLFLDLHMSDGKIVEFGYTQSYDSDNDTYEEYPEAFVRDFVNYFRDKNIPVKFNCTYKDVTAYDLDDKSLAYMEEIFQTDSKQ